MKRPAFQFYPGDWQRNAKLRRCTHAEKGAWIDILCLLHDNDTEYGVLRWPLRDIAQAIGAKLADVKRLVEKGVLKGCDEGEAEIAPFIFTPRHGGKNGDPVTLLPVQSGPIWYSSRMVRDEYVRANAGASTRFKPGQPNPGMPRHAGNATTERARLRAAVLEKTDGHCAHCKTQLRDSWEIDHLIPRARGGRHTFSNMVPACVDCNQDKSDSLPDDWSTPSRTPTQRQGEEPTQRQGHGSSSASASAGNSKPPDTPSSSARGREGAIEPEKPRALGSVRPSALLAIELRKLGCDINPDHPQAVEWASKGVTVEHVCVAMATARARPGKGAGNIAPGYLAPIVAELLNPPLPGRGRPTEPDFSKLDYRQGVSPDGKF